MTYYNEKKILVTGATGLIGKELITPLKELGFEIYAITIDENNLDNGVYWLNGNLFDEDFIKTTMEQVKPQYLLNMAWATTGDYLNSNLNYKFLTAGINLIKYFKFYEGKRAVYAGTCFEYKFKDTPLLETDELEPKKNAYSFCKNKLNEIVEFFCKMNGISFGYGRIFYVYGRNEDKSRLTGMVLDNLRNNKEVIIKSGDLKKDYIYTKDIASAFASFIDSDIEGAVNICTGNAISIKEYVLTLAKAMGKEDLIIFKNELSSQPPIIVGNNSRLVNEVKYKIKYPLNLAIMDILNTQKKENIYD